MIGSPSTNSSAVDGASYSSSHNTNPHNTEHGGGATSMGGHSSAHQAVHQRASTAYPSSANSSHNGSSGSPATPPTSPSTHTSGIPRPSAIPSSSAAAPGSSSARREPYFSSERSARMRAPAEEPHIGKYKLLKVFPFFVIQRQSRGQFFVY